MVPGEELEQLFWSRSSAKPPPPAGRPGPKAGTRKGLQSGGPKIGCQRWRRSAVPSSAHGSTLLPVSSTSSKDDNDQCDRLAGEGSIRNSFGRRISAKRNVRKHIAF